MEVDGRWQVSAVVGPGGSGRPMAVVLADASDEALATALATAPGGGGAVLGTPKDASCAAGRSGVVPGADPPQHMALIESAHPLPAEPAPMLHHISLEGATNLCLTFDPRFATHPNDL